MGADNAPAGRRVIGIYVRRNDKRPKPEMPAVVTLGNRAPEATGMSNVVLQHIFDVRPGRSLSGRDLLLEYLADCRCICLGRGSCSQLSLLTVARVNSETEVGTLPI